MNELIFFAGGVLVALGGGLGYIKYKLLQQRLTHDKLYDNLHAKYVFENEQKVQLSVDSKRLKEELEGYKQEYKLTGDMYDQLKRDFQQLADEHNELKEKHAPFASLNPFEQQAVSAMTDQSVYNEWLNGAPKEVK